MGTELWYVNEGSASVYVCTVCILYVYVYVHVCVCVWVTQNTEKII